MNKNIYSQWTPSSSDLVLFKNIWTFKLAVDAIDPLEATCQADNAGFIIMYYIGTISLAPHLDRHRVSYLTVLPNLFDTFHPNIWWTPNF